MRLSDEVFVVSSDLAAAVFFLDRGLGSFASFLFAGGRGCILSTSVRHHHSNMILLLECGPLPIEVVLLLPVAILLMADHAAWTTLLFHTMPQLLRSDVMLLVLDSSR